MRQLSLFSYNRCTDYRLTLTERSCRSSADQEKMRKTLFIQTTKKRNYIYAKKVSEIKGTQSRGRRKGALALALFCILPALAGALFPPLHTCPAALMPSQGC